LGIKWLKVEGLLCLWSYSWEYYFQFWYSRNQNNTKKYFSLLYFILYFRYK